jgi:cystathionine beta-lyase/cystathionine gamma-synthase
LIRLSPGIEHAADLIDDLREGLHAVATAHAKPIVICV